MNTSQRKIFWLFAILIIANGIDLIATIYFLESKWMIEANPLMAAAYELSPLAFTAAKLALVSFFGILLLFLDKNAEDPRGFARKGLYTVVISYIAVSLYHAFFLLIR